MRLRSERVGLADVLCSQGASLRRPRVCSFVQGYLPWRAHTVEAVCAPFSFEAAHRIRLVVRVGLWGYLRNQVVPRWNIVPVLVRPSLALPFEPRLGGWVRLPLQLRYVPRLRWLPGFLLLDAPRSLRVHDVAKVGFGRSSPFRPAI